ncbi:hypothetical protein BDAP_000677 [Binucleata daphniae]
MDIDTDFKVLQIKKLKTKEAKKVLKDFIKDRDDLEDFQKVQIEEIIENMTNNEN